MKRINQYQSGWTFWSLLFTLSVLGFAAYVGIRLVPIYSDNENIKNAMELAMNGVTAQSVSRSAILRRMGSQLYLDGMTNAIDLKESVKIKRDKQNIILNVDYEREVPIIANVSLLIKFDNELVKKSSGT